MTDSRSARTSTQVLVQGNSDARSARTSTQVLVQGNSDARVARVSVQVLVKIETTLGGGWGTVAIGL